MLLSRAQQHFNCVLKSALCPAENLSLSATTTAVPPGRSNAISPQSAQQRSASKSSASKRKGTPEEPQSGAAQLPAPAAASAAGARPKRQRGAQQRLPSNKRDKGRAAASACLLSAEKHDEGTRQPCAQSSGRAARASSTPTAAQTAAGAGSADRQEAYRAGDPDGVDFGDELCVPDTCPGASGSAQGAADGMPPNQAAPDQAPPGGSEGSTPLREALQLGAGGSAARQGTSAEAASGSRARSAAYMERRISALGRSARKPEAPNQALHARAPAPSGNGEASRALPRKTLADRAAQTADARQDSAPAPAAGNATGSRAGAGADQPLVSEEHRKGAPAQDGAAAEGVRPVGRAAGRSWVSAWVAEVATTTAEPGAGAAEGGEVEEAGAAAAPVQGERARLASGQLPSGSRGARKGRLKALLAQAQQKVDKAGARRAGNRRRTAARRQPKGRAGRGAGSTAQHAEAVVPADADAVADDRGCGASCAPAAAAAVPANPGVAADKQVRHTCLPAYPASYGLFLFLMPKSRSLAVHVPVMIMTQS